MDAELEFDLEMQVVAAPRLDVDAEFDLGPLGQARRRAGIFKRQILDVLANDLEIGGRRRPIILAGYRRSAAAHCRLPVDRGPRATMVASA